MNHIVEPRMHMYALDSSAIAHVGHDPTTLVLRLEYTSGGLYEYFEVPVSVFNALRRAPSAGEFVNLHVKPFYSYSEIEH